MPKLVVVGGGILGTMHALMAVRSNWDVVQLESDRTARSASVRNFGLVWVSGRRGGPELDLALRSRELWEEIGAEVSGVHFRPSGSLTVALSQDELDVVIGSLDLIDASKRGFEVLTPSQIKEHSSVLAGDKIAGGLFCSKDAIVEPRSANAAIQEYLSKSPKYEIKFDTRVQSRRENSVVDQNGVVYSGDKVVICTGANLSGPFELERAPLRPVRLQMAQTAPLAATIPFALADADSFRYYPAFESLVTKLGTQDPASLGFRAQLLVVQRIDGSLTIGDTHQYDEPFEFDLYEEPYSHFLNRLEAIFGSAPPPLVRRWEGVYLETTDPGVIYYRYDDGSGVEIVNGPGGKGMTCSAAIAEESMRIWQG